MNNKITIDDILEMDNVKYYRNEYEIDVDQPSDEFYEVVYNISREVKRAKMLCATLLIIAILYFLVRSYVL